jgi:kynurenine formamidase
LVVRTSTISARTVYVVENLKLDELAARRVYEFALTMQPLKLRGGTGSTVAPAAIR